MTDPITVSALRELVVRGLIAAQPPAEPLPAGNVDRRDAASRTSWRVSLPDGRPARLLLGTGLAGLAQRQAALAQACPGLIPPPVFHQLLPSGEAFADLFFEGESLEAAAGRSPDNARQGFARVCAELAATSQPATESARQAEWQAWTGSVESLACWTPAEKELLRTLVWPRLGPLLCATPPATRWTNGDFTSANILIGASGDARLIDCEFASLTHFFPEDAVRFQLLSPVARRQPALFAGQMPENELPWHLYFWLRQFQLEVGYNTPAYVARVQPVRLGVIRRFAEHILGLKLEGWSTPPLPLEAHLDEARWLQEHGTTVRVSGWCHVPSAAALHRVIALSDGRRVAETGPSLRADVQQHFPSSPQAGLSGFTLSAGITRVGAGLTLCAVFDDGLLLPFLSLTTENLARGAPLLDHYAEWAGRYDPDPPAKADIPAGPLISVLLPVYNPPIPFLRACLESVLAQHYPDWELRIVNDGSTAGEIAACLDEFAGKDSRLHVRHLRKNRGISRASNVALASARGEFVVLLDHDDVLRPHALAEFVRALATRPQLDAIYSDEDKISAEGRRLAPILKPGFSPEFLLGVMYIGHALCVRTRVARAAGGFDPAFDGVQDYEFFLRVTEQSQKIGHLPRMLYHWRQSPASSALHGNIKGNMDEKQARAVQAHLHRRHDQRRLKLLNGHRVQLSAGPAASPTRIGLILVWTGVVSAEHRFWENLGVSPVTLFAFPDTGVPAAVTVTRLAAQAPHTALRLAAETSGLDTLVLLSAPFVSASVGWLSELAACAALADSGCVAPLLISRDKRVLESGWTAGPAGFAPIMRGYDPEGDGSHGSLRCTREVAAVSPLCVALSRKHLRRAPPPAENTWWDFCRGLSEAGLFNRVCPVAQLVLGAALPESPVASATSRPADMFFNPHFEPRLADYTLASPPAHYTPVASPLLWYFDRVPATVLADGCLRLEGWIFHHNRQPVAVRASIGGLAWTVSANEPRPDVALAHPGRTEGGCGFRVSLRVPPGEHRLVVAAVASDGGVEPLSVQPVAVPRLAGLRRFFSADPVSLVSFQMMATPTHAPCPVRAETFPARIAKSEAGPKFTIVTPSYQQVRFLGETLRSVLEQPGVQVDYVVQDGGSTDGSAALIERAAKEQGGRLVAWESAPDTGQADAIAKGFARTAGAPDDVMAWLNSDDFYLPGTLAFVADYFARHPDVDVLYGHRIVVDDQSSEIGRWFLPPHDAEILQHVDFVPQETLFWRRRIWEKAGGIDAAFKFALDWDLLLRFQAAGARIVRVPYFLACFRVHAAQKTSALMHSTGQKEITQLRERTHGRALPPQELERHPRLLRYLRRSALIEFLWSLGIRAP